MGQHSSDTFTDMQLTVLVLVFVSFVHCYREKPQEDVELSRVVSDAWINDPNRLKVGQDLLLNWQGQISDESGSKDVSPAPLCTIKSTKLSQDPVYKAFIALLNNYEHRVGISETETAEKKKEIDQFLDAVIKTKTMETFHNYLVKQKLASASPATFKKELHDLWFKMYKRVSLPAQSSKNKEGIDWRVQYKQRLTADFKLKNKNTLPTPYI
ncbi:hypothetical protein ACTXT7_012477 [Hymenolepis weldensis]